MENSNSFLDWIESLPEEEQTGMINFINGKKRWIKVSEEISDVPDSRELTPEEISLRKQKAEMNLRDARRIELFEALTSGKSARGSSEDHELYGMFEVDGMI